MSGARGRIRPHGIFVVGGGTAGHVLPALAVAAALIDRGVDPASLHFVGSRRGMEAHLVPEAGFAITLLPGRGIVRRLTWQSVVALLGLIVAWLRALLLVLRARPTAVVAVGGYAAVPCGMAAALCRRPMVVVNLDAEPGAANRLLGRFARVCAVAFPGTRLPRAVVTGPPVRREVLAVSRDPAGRAAAREALSLDGKQRVVAVTGGSLGARRLNESALGLAALWKDRRDVCLYHVCGERSYEELAPRAPAEFGGLTYRLVAFEPRMPELFAAADLVIARAGASTVGELAAIGTPSLLVPLPNAPRDHQRRNAEALVKAGAGRLILDAEATPERLAEEAGALLVDADRLEKMGRAASALARPDAAARIAELVLSSAARRPVSAQVGAA